MLRLRTLFRVALLSLCGAGTLAAQTTSTITGKVEDSSGAVLAGAQVTARHLDTGTLRSITTNAEGRFLFPALSVGRYDVRAEYAGFRPLVHEDIRVAVGETAVVNFTLQVGAVEQEIKVVGQSPLVETRSGDLSYLVSEGAIQDLPLNGRNFTDLALLQPGVIAFPHRDGGSVVAHGLATSINGQDPRSNVYLLDGTPLNDFTNGPAGSAAGTALGMETIREFRVEANAYSAEFGRNSGGQVNVVSKSGTNDLRGSLIYFHRNDNLDARNFFDPANKPEFKRNQYGATLGGPARRDQSFLFFGYEGLRERQGRTILTVVPDNAARTGVLPSTTPVPGVQCPTTTVTINAAVAPYLNEFPVANGAAILDAAGCPTGLANHSFLFPQNLDQDFVQFRYDHNLTPRHQFFARYTYDGASQALPTDFPQFPRAFLSRNQFFTGTYTNILTPSTLQNFRLSFSRTRIGQAVEANTSAPLQPFVPGRPMLGNIDIGGIPRFGPQTSVNVQLVQNVIGFEYGFVQTRGRHLLKFGGMAERYQDNMVNPTFSLGIFTFPSLRTFLLNQPQRFLGLTPTGELDRYWRFTLFGLYLQDDIQLLPNLTINLGLRYEAATLPKDIYGRDSTLITLSDAAPTLGQLYQNPTKKNISPRIGFAWDVFGGGRTSVRGGYAHFFNTNNQQNIIVTVTNPPFTPRIVVANPTFPVPPFTLTGATSIRPIQWDLKNPNLHVWNLNVQQQLWGQTVVTLGYAGSRGIHLLRSNDVNIPQPQIQPGGTPFFAAGLVRPNPNFSTIELKSSDGNSWYNALVFEVRKRWSRHLTFQSSYTFSRNIDTTQASTFFSDATNGTTSAFPEYPGFNYNRGLADYHAKHNWVMNFMLRLPFEGGLQGTARRILGGWHLAGIATVRSGQPLTVFVQRNRSRSLWSPSLGPGIGFDRPSILPGRTHRDAVLGRPDSYFDPTAFVLQPAGTFGNLGRGAFIGPDLRAFDLALIKDTPVPAWGREANIQFRVEAFNLFNRANFGTPSLTAFVGAVDGEPPLSTFGRIRSTVTSSRQIQLGMRIQF